VVGTIYDFVTVTLTNANFTGAIVKGANFTGSGLAASQLYSTASYASGDLTGIGLAANNLTGWNFANQNLTNASFFSREAYGTSVLTNATFRGAIVKGANFSGTTYYGFTASQLYSTASYSSGDLTGIVLDGNKMTGWNFANQNLSNAQFDVAYLAFENSDEAVYANLTNANLTNANLTGAVFYDSTLTNANFTNANLTGARVGSTLTNANFTNASLANAVVVGNMTNTNFTGADLRGAFWYPNDGSIPTTIITHDTIRPDGSIQGLALQAGEKLVIRNDPIAITVTTSASIDNAATLQFLLDDAWTSPVGFAPGLIPALGGTLDLELAAGVDPASLLGESFQLFDWNGALPVDNQFATITTEPGLTFDVSNLYSTGNVTLTAVPEPSSLALCLLALGALLLLAWRRKRTIILMLFHHPWPRSTS
jgi:uncharacterized protein YjbI with pentapeptide repeats